MCLSGFLLFWLPSTRLFVTYWRTAMASLGISSQILDLAPTSRLLNHFSTQQHHRWLFPVASHIADFLLRFVCSCFGKSQVELYQVCRIRLFYISGLSMSVQQPTTEISLQRCKHCSRTRKHHTLKKRQRKVHQRSDTGQAHMQQTTLLNRAYPNL